MAKEKRPDTIRLLRECHDTCLETLSLHCLKAGGNHTAREHLRRMQSAIELCKLTADFLLRRSPMTQELCDLCAEACKQCAASCNSMADLQMTNCANACEQAARVCLEESHHLRAIAA